MNETIKNLLKRFSAFIIFFSLFTIINLTLLNFDNDDLIKNTLNNTYYYGNETAQDFLNRNINNLCRNVLLVKGENLENENISTPIQELCLDKEKISQLNEQCAIILSSNYSDENIEPVVSRENCETISSTNFEEICEDLLESENGELERAIQVESLRDVCVDLNESKITYNQAFLDLSINQINNLESNNLPVNKNTNILGVNLDINDYKKKVIIIFSVLFVLFILVLFFMYEEKLKFFHQISKLVLRLGVLMILPYLIIKIIFLVRAPDTSSIILSSVAGDISSFSVNSLIDLVCLTLLSLITIKYLIISLIFLSLGGFFSFILKPVEFNSFKNKKKLLTEEEELLVRKDLGLKEKEIKKSIFKK
jgi:hypothetical protein